MIHKYVFLCLWIWFSHGVIGDTDEVKSVSVTEGDSVSLNSGVSEVQRDDLILWMFNFNNSEIRIAEIHKQVIDMFNSKEIFGDRLQMDSRTGSLTIRNIRTEHSGFYKLQIIKAGVTYKSFSVAVYAPLPIPVITRDTSNCSSSSSSKRSSVSRCSLLCSVVNVRAVTLSWYKGNSLFSSISVSDLSISLSLPLEIECLDDSYSCVINNPISNQTTHLDITHLCHTCPDLIQKSQTVVISVIVMALIVVVVGGVIYLYNKKCKQACSEDPAIIEKQSMSEYTQIIYCLQMRDLPQKSLLDVGRTETAVNYQHNKIKKAAQEIIRPKVIELI
ncbi:SLAM family member 9 isoform X2 [Carassius gibelio]|uniref:SLAM family member 9 isoform X2 n=1 Tax=Carassius gibelio TaxID=101364 RepID=UPI002278FA7A|nr:SLAM family member 9 isoform X2 [Carassius gibelio]